MIKNTWQTYENKSSEEIEFLFYRLQYQLECIRKIYTKKVNEEINTHYTNVVERFK